MFIKAVMFNKYEFILKLNKKYFIVIELNFVLICWLVSPVDE